MSQTANCKKSLVAVLALFMACAAFAVVADDSDAANVVSIGTIKETKEFQENHSGTITVNVNNGEGQKVTVTLTAKEGSSVKDTETIELDPEHGTNVEMSFTLGSGDHTITVTATGTYEDGTTAPIVGGPLEITVHSNSSVWSGWMAYAALVVVVIIAALMVYMWMRGRPKKTPGVTFADLEQGKVPAQAQQPSDTSKKMYTAEPKTESKTEKSSSGRMKYVSDRRK